MRRLLALLMMIVAGTIGTLYAQDDGLNLPTALYILLNEGQIERYSVGVGGVAEVTPEDVFVVDFGISPDGRWLAYRAQDGLFTQDMAADDFVPVMIEPAQTANFPPYRRGGQTMTWSPTGGTLAYTTDYGARIAFEIATATPRFADIAVSPLANLVWSAEGAYLAAEADDNIWWVYRRDGYNMVLAGALPSSIGAAWLDNTRLIFAPEAGGLYLIDFANQNQQTELQAPPRLYRYPTVRADGDIAVFTRLVSDAGLEETQAYLRQLRFNDGQTTVLDTSTIPVELSGITWAPRGELTVAARGGVLILLQPSSGQGFPLPVANVVAFGWGGLQEDVADTLDVAGYFLANDVLNLAQVWRIRPDEPAQVLTAGFEDVLSYALNRNGRSLAYVTEGALWLLDTTNDSAEPQVIAEVDDSTRGLNFSADGGLIFYADDEGLWQVQAAAGSTPRLLLTNTEGVIYDAPQYAPNINAILIKTSPGRGEFAFFDLSSEALLMIGAYDNAAWMSDGRILAWNNTLSGAQIAIVNPTTDPAGVTSLANLPGEHVYDFRQADLANFRLVVGGISPRAPGFMRIINLPITGDNPLTVSIFPAVTYPALSPDGERVVGGSGFNRLLTTPETAETLAEPGGVQSFIWMP